MSSKQIGEPTEEINILLRRTAVPKCDITPAVKGLKRNHDRGNISNRTVKKHIMHDTIT